MACSGACGHRTSSSVWRLITDSLGTSLSCWKWGRQGGKTHRNIDLELCICSLTGLGGNRISFSPWPFLLGLTVFMAREQGEDGGSLFLHQPLGSSHHPWAAEEARGGQREKPGSGQNPGENSGGLCISTDGISLLLSSRWGSTGSSVGLTFPPLCLPVHRASSHSSLKGGEPPMWLMLPPVLVLGA